MSAAELLFLAYNFIQAFTSDVSLIIFDEALRTLSQTALNIESLFIPGRGGGIFSRGKTATEDYLKQNVHRKPPYTESDPWFI